MDENTSISPLDLLAVTLFASAAVVQEGRLAVGEDPVGLIVL